MPFASLLTAISAPVLMSALTIVPSVNIALVTVPVSPVVTTAPVTFGSVIVRSAVGSTTVSVVSKAFSVAPSKTTFASFSSRLPVIVPPLLASFSVSTSANAV